tara:strand:+ start:1057 stop:1455 length:399 start_codon:yes stop_codon:yes gene_type:complete
VQLEKNFNIDEFKCKDGTSVPDEYLSNVELLAKNLQVLRDKVGLPIIIISGYRSPEYNKKIGGAKRSQHMLAKAADIIIKGMSSTEVKNVIISLIKSGEMHPGGIGLYQTFTHYDVRGQNRRWYGSGMKPKK